MTETKTTESTRILGVVFLDGQRWQVYKDDHRFYLSRNGIDWAACLEIWSDESASLAQALFDSLGKVQELEEKLAAQPKFVAIRGIQPGDLVFLTPTRDLSAQESLTLSQSVREFSRANRIRIAILPAGFSVSGMPAEDEVCIYTPNPNYDAPGLRGDEKHFKTDCGNGWLLTMGRSLHPFCAWCGKPVVEATEVNKA